MADAAPDEGNSDTRSTAWQPDQVTTVVVLGAGFAPLGVVRSLGQAGLNPYLVAPRSDFAARSRWVRGRVLRIPEGNDPAALLAGLERHGIKRAVLIACTDVWSTAVARVSHQAPDRFPTCMPSPEILELLVDKWLFSQTLEQFDVAQPRTIAVRGEDDLVGHGLESPFLKPRNSQLFAARFHRKAFMFSTPQEAQEAYRKVVDAGLEAVLQEYISGPSSGHVFVEGFVDREGTVCAVVARRRLRMFPPDLGNSTFTVTIAPEEAADAIDGVTRLLQGIGYRGIFSAEFKLDPRDGQHKLIEVNSRPWWQIGFVVHCGIDLPTMAYRDALGLPVERSDVYPVGARYVLLPHDTRAFLHHRRRGELSLRTWLRSIAGAKGAVADRDDPLPALSLPIFYALRPWRRFRGRG